MTDFIAGKLVGSAQGIMLGCPESSGRVLLMVFTFFDLPSAIA